MTTINVRDARESIAKLLDLVQTGEEVIILRRGKPVARLIGPERTGISFPDRSQLRKNIPPMPQSAADLVRSLRDEERY
ncbi:MAG: type II toxin-antitoxin system prevent-host-death family antitoxin [Nitrococcus sp.]|nr:type II toxin-antitoxin system prevent-host-death family antitoxin [Nitrococcus sp.]